MATDSTGWEGARPWTTNHWISRNITTHRRRGAGRARRNSQPTRLTFACYAVATFVALFRSYRESGVEERRQVKWPIWATMVAVGGKVILAIVGFGILFLTTFRNVSLPTILNYLPEITSKSLYVLIPLAFAFAILKYRLMNIDVIIRRTVLYSLLTFVVFALYAVLVAGVGTALVKFAGLTSQTMLVASTVVIALAAVPIRNRLQHMVDRNLFRERRDYPLGLRNIGNASSSLTLLPFVSLAVQAASPPNDASGIHGAADRKFG